MSGVVFVTIALALSIQLALGLNKDYQEQNPDFKPFRWGYFFIVSGVIVGLVMAGFQFYLASKTYGSRAVAYGFIGVYCLVGAILHALAFKRNRWMLALATIYQFNPLIWVINILYLRSRWDEFAGRPLVEMGRSLTDSSGHRAADDEKPRWMDVLGINQNWIKRAGALSCLWAAFVLMVVWLFEPYGSYMSGKEEAQVFKIAVFVPLFFIAASLLLKWMQKGSAQEPRKGRI